LSKIGRFELHNVRRQLDESENEYKLTILKRKYRLKPQMCPNCQTCTYWPQNM